MIVSINAIVITAIGLLAAAVALSAAALLVAGRVTRRAGEAARRAAAAELQLGEFAATLARVEGEIRALQADRDRAAATPTRPSLRQAVALSRHGASTEELMATCRIGQSEARLIQMLYNAPRPETVGADTEVH